MKKLKRLQYGDFLIKGKNLMEVMIEKMLSDGRMFLI